MTEPNAAALAEWLEGEEFHTLCMNYRGAQYSPLSQSPQHCFELLQDAIKRVALRAKSPSSPGEGGAELAYAQRLAAALHRQYFSKVTHWRVGEDLMLVLTQIDNMVARLKEP